MAEKPIGSGSRTVGLARKPEEFKTGSLAHKKSDQFGISIVSGIALKTCRREIESLKFNKKLYDQGEAESWALRNYARIRMWEAGLNGEPVPPELVI